MWKFIRKNWLLILSLIYLVSPINIIPDFVAGPLGLIDDVGIVLFLLLRAFLNQRKENQDLKKASVLASSEQPKALSTK